MTKRAIKNSEGGEMEEPSDREIDSRQRKQENRPEIMAEFVWIATHHIGVETDQPYFRCQVVERPVAKDDIQVVVVRVVENAGGGQDVEQKLSPSRTNERIVEVNLADVLPCNDVELSAIGELGDLEHLHEAAVLHVLENRFREKKPYTNAYGICIAVNPYEWIDDIYTNDLQDRYFKHESEEPHVYQVSTASFQHFVQENVSQSILVSGESGSGKTETTKLLMQHFARISSTVNVNETVSQVLMSNPILEAFGNAQTVRNNNSSRFGKYIQLHFDETHQLCGATIQAYLLEKSRIISQSKNERNYHVLYQLVNGCLDKTFSDHYFQGRVDWKALQTNMLKTADEKQGKITVKALETFGIPLSQVLPILASVIFLCQIEFEHTEDMEGCKIDAKDTMLLKAEELLQCSLVDALTSRTMMVGNESYKVPLKKEQGEAACAALAKSLYASMFHWIVGKINQTISPNEGGNVKPCSISILDLFGFECFENNSLEQLCINFANERLQQIFNDCILKETQHEYEREGVPWTRIDFSDGSEVIEMIQNPKNSIFSFLQEESLLPKGTSTSFVSKLLKNQNGGKLQPHRFDKTSFTVVHYAAQVTYDGELFLEKNLDRLHADLHNLLLGQSGNPFVKQLGETIPSASSTAHTVTRQFKSQLNDLVETIQKTNARFVRCIKPNGAFSSHLFERSSSLQQLRCSGVIEAIKISRAGFPDRLTFDQIRHRFPGGGFTDGVAICQAFLAVQEEEYFVGKSKVFFPHGSLEKLSQKYHERRNQAILRLQTLFRRVLACKYVQRLGAAKVIQFQWRATVQRKHYLLFRQAIVNLQNRCRGRIAKRLFLKMRVAVVTIQANVRMRIRYQSLKKMKASVVVAQAVSRMILARKRATSIRKSFIKIQAWFRMCHQMWVFAPKLAKYREQNSVTTLKTQVSEMELRMLEMQQKLEQFEKENSLLKKQNLMLRKVGKQHQLLQKKRSPTSALGAVKIQDQEVPKRNEVKKVEVENRPNTVDTINICGQEVPKRIEVKRVEVENRSNLVNKKMNDNGPTAPILKSMVLAASKQKQKLQQQQQQMQAQRQKAPTPPKSQAQPQNQQRSSSRSIFGNTAQFMKGIVNSGEAFMQTFKEVSSFIVEELDPMPLEPRSDEASQGRRRGRSSPAEAVKQHRLQRMNQQKVTKAHTIAPLEEGESNVYKTA